MTDPVYRTNAWKRVRRRVLDRDNHECQIRGPKCIGTATTVDHITPVNAGGAWYDERNLRAACGPCNYGRVSAEANDRWKSSSTRIVLVVGPPGAGKSTYVDAHRAPDDVVIDYDLIASALGSAVGHQHLAAHHAVTMKARNAVITSLRRGEIGAPRVWLISAAADAEQRFPHHEVVVIDPGREEVLGRGEPDRAESSTDSGGQPGRSHFVKLVDDWYDRRGIDSNAAAGASRSWWRGRVSDG